MKKLNKTTINNLRTMIRVWYWADEESEIICDMLDFSPEGDMSSKDPKHICGSVCCGLGMAPLHIRPIEEDYQHQRFVYDLYSNRIFPSLSGWSRTWWRWVFDSSWGDSHRSGTAIDDTFRGVALRANYLLNNSEKVTVELLPDPFSDVRDYMFHKDNHDRTIPYLEAERKGGNNNV